MSTEYVAIVVTRNGATFLESTIRSILAQIVTPVHVCVVDDGSTDKTRAVLERLSSENNGTIGVVRLPNRGYDIRRVASNLNKGYEYFESHRVQFLYSMISGDDCLFPRDYSEKLLTEMRHNPRLAVASGDWGVRAPPDAVRAPQGAGRFVLEEFWRKLGGRYPEAYGWETWLLFRALQSGYQTKCFTDIRFKHLRPSGTSHRFRYWGAAMRALGYHPLMVLSRVAKNILLESDQISISGSLIMLAGYLTGQKGDSFYHKYDEDLRAFVRRYQAQRIAAGASRIASLFRRVV